MVGDTHIFHLSCFAKREELFHESISRFKKKHREAKHVYLFLYFTGNREGKHEKNILHLQPYWITYKTIRLTFFILHYCHYHSSLLVFGGDGGQTKMEEERKYMAKTDHKKCCLFVSSLSLSFALVLRLME